MATESRKKAFAALSWAGAIAITAYLVRKRWFHPGTNLGPDFTLWLRAAKEVAAGHSPYVLPTFVYPPPIALLLAPFVHAAPAHLWQAWTALEIACLVVGVAAFVFQESVHLRSWPMPVLFAFCSFTVLHFWPTVVSLFFGQTDAFVFVVLLLAGLMASRGRGAAQGTLLGVAGLLKTWPAAVGLVLFQRGLKNRRQAVVAFVLTTLVAPILIVAVGGGSGLVNFVKNNFDARTQNIVSESVFGAPRLLFSHTGIARPLLVSPGLRVAVTAILLVWVIALLVMALRTSGHPSLCLWNVTLCVVLLLPISHLTYTLFAVPILWVWASRILADAPRWASREIAVLAVLLACWIFQQKSWTSLGNAPNTASARYCIVFAASLIACSVSVVGARALLGQESDAEPGSVAPPKQTRTVAAA